jgi:hypothetical protein
LLNNKHLPRKPLLVLALIAGLGLTGCVVEPQYSHQIDRATLTAIPAPPAPVAETVPPAPYVDSYWIPGHWRWEGDRFLWTNGHWEQSRPNMLYHNAYWSNEHGGWIFHPGQWVQEAPAMVETGPVITVAPPPPQVEVITVAPGPGFFWIGGYWNWVGGRHVWMGGHWEAHRPGYFYAPGHWVQHSNGWAFASGRWVRH